MYRRLKNAPLPVKSSRNLFFFLLFFVQNKSSSDMQVSRTQSFASSCRFNSLACGRHRLYSTCIAMEKCTDHSLTSCKRRQRVNQSHKHHSHTLPHTHTHWTKEKHTRVLHQPLQHELQVSNKSIVLIICSSTLLYIVPSGHLPRKVKNYPKL